jgi:hypothetical protein
VLFDKKLNDYYKTIEFTIDNYDIREEFDAVKNYFANVLNTKKIQVTATIELTDNEVTSKSAKSPEIDKINQKLIDNVKFEFVKATKKKVTVDVGQQRFSAMLADGINISNKSLISSSSGRRNSIEHYLYFHHQ